MGIPQRIVFREAFPLNMAVFDKNPPVLESDILVRLLPIFAGRTNRIVDIEYPDHFSPASFIFQVRLFVLLIFPDFRNCHREAP